MKSTWTKIFLSTSLLTLAACSGGGGGGGGASTESMLSARKLTCGGSDCVGSSLASFMESIDVMGGGNDPAVDLYRSFNSDMIPAFNAIIAKIEKGVALTGAVSCDDITEYDVEKSIPDMGLTAVATTSTVSIPTGFTLTGTVQKKLKAKYTAGGTPMIEADVHCGGGTDANPLTARILAADDGRQLNAWFERGSANHFRILMAASGTGFDVAAWFATNDGDTFEMILGTGAEAYSITGKKSLNKIRVLMPSSLLAGDFCLSADNLETATDCGAIKDPSAIVPPAFAGLLSSGGFNGSRNLASPVY